MSDARLPSGMEESGPHEAFLASLVADLRPVRPVGKPIARTLFWLLLLLAMTFGLAWFADMSAVARRLTAVPHLREAVAGSVLTMILAGLAAFHLALPDRSPRWALLPLPGLVLWIAASGLGCARGLLIPGTPDASLGETMHCLRFIVGLSLPMSFVLARMLRRGYSLYPSLTGAMAGLSAAAAAATLLNFFHPYDATMSDLAVHAFAVGLVVAANRFLGGLVFRRRAMAGLAERA